LQAIRAYGSTISEAVKESRTLTIEFKDSIVMQTEFINLKLIVTLKGYPSANFKFIMEDLAYDIYKQYGEEIDKFTGILKPFHNMSELIEKHLNVSFLYPLKIEENPEMNLNDSEKELVDKVRKFMKKKDFNHFYSLYLMPKNYFKKDDIDGDDYDRFPYPYIYNPPKPPDDLAPAAQVQVRTPSEEKNSEEEVNCQYCGMDITKEEQFTHSCKKKPE
jgi:hypothetical protein